MLFPNLVFVRYNRRRGFTLMELLVVIAIVGILASVVLASLNSSRTKADNARILSQMEEYRKAMDLIFLDLGYFPNAVSVNPVSNRQRRMCFGDGAVANCMPPISHNSVTPTDPNFEFYVELRKYMKQLPRFEHTSGGTNYSSPLYSGCAIANGNPALPNNNTDPTGACSVQAYSLWFLLDGANQNCGDAVSVDDTFGSANDLTLCRLVGGN